MSETEPYYREIKGEIRIFEEAFKRQLPVLLKGPTGCGKTRFVEHMAWRLRTLQRGSIKHRPELFLTVACHEDMTSADLAGHYTFDLKRGAYWVDGPLSRCARQGGICYLDEVAEARPDVTVLIHPLADHRRTMPLPQKGEEIAAHPGFMLVLSFNPGYQSLLKEMKPSTRQRFVTIEFGYPAAEREAEIIVRETGMDPILAGRFADAAEKIRRLKDQGLSEGVSTRLLIHAGHLIQGGIPHYDAIETAIVQPLTDDPDIANAVREVLKAFGLGSPSRVAA